MTKMADHNPREYGEERRRRYRVNADVQPPKVDLADEKITKLYGPKGEVLRTYSNRPPIGFA